MALTIYPPNHDGTATGNSRRHQKLPRQGETQIADKKTGR
jgi:hypothetical protein